MFIWFGYKAVVSGNFYLSLNSSTKGKIENIEIKNIKNRYKVFVTYSFDVSNKTFVNTSSYRKFFLNPFVAQDYKNEILKKDFRIFYNQKNPFISSVEKNLPLKNFIYAAVSFVIFLYFLILKILF